MQNDYYFVIMCDLCGAYGDQCKPWLPWLVFGSIIGISIVAAKISNYYEERANEGVPTESA